MRIYRGDVFYAELDPVVGSEQGGIRPVVIIQNDIANRHSPTVIIAPVTSKPRKNKLPTHVFVKADENGLIKDSLILLEQIRTIDKSRLKAYIGRVDESVAARADNGLLAALGID